MSTTLIAGLTAAAAIGAAPVAASAQTQNEQATNVGEIVVTGSRIRRSPTNSPTPLIQIGQEELLQSGEVNVIDFLADIPARDNLTVRAGVVNAFDAEPARWLGGTSSDNFDLFGRRFFLSLNYRPF